jgi:1-acyl-sn-glycerol-3-phosphate acyltransferase
MSSPTCPTVSHGETGGEAQNVDLGSRTTDLTGVPAPPPLVPRRRGWLSALIGRLGLRALGWRISGELPNRAKMVAIVAPHTSNWDFVVGFLAYLALRIDCAWWGKHSIFRGPFGPLLRRYGGIPVVRSQSSNIVERTVEEFARRERMLLALAPEGTRSKVETWRTGFYHVARGAGAPVLTVALNFGERVVEIGPLFELTDDQDADIARLRARFATVRGKRTDRT